MAAVAEQARIPAVPAYLDLAQPDLSAAAQQFADAGHATAIVVPLLFTEAYHATIDVPETVRDVAESLPLELVVADILGTGEDVAQLLRQSMGEAGIDDDSSVLLFAVGSSKPEANEAVFDLAHRLAQGRRSPVRRLSAPAPLASPMSSTGWENRSRSCHCSSLRACCFPRYALSRHSMAGGSPHHWASARPTSSGSDTE